MNTPDQIPDGSAEQGRVRGGIVENMIGVIVKPAEFFRAMPKKGGYAKPLVFLVAMAVLTAVIGALLGVLGFGPTGVLAMGFIGIILLPVMAIIGSFIGAAILFVIWKIMGSSEEYETAYRCVAYGYAYAPVAMLVSGIPYLGSLVMALWPMALMAIASIHVHGRSTVVSWVVFGLLGGLFALSSVGIERSVRMLSSEFGGMQQKNIEEMTPEEAGKALGEFLKGFRQQQQ